MEGRSGPAVCQLPLIAATSEKGTEDALIKLDVEEGGGLRQEGQGFVRGSWVVVEMEGGRGGRGADYN